MDKYEYKVRAEEIKQLIAQEEYAQAADIADTIDWRRVKSVMMLCTISDLYKINRRYEDARDMLLLAYERRPGGRTICYSLCELSIKMEEYVQAVEYYKEFVQVAPKDSGRYILQYKLYEAQDVSLEERIEVLEELKKRDYREKWAYELAYLYHRVGLATKCVEECDEMILWFGEGKYVIKAMELKKLHQPLTPAQQEKYDNRFLMAEVRASVQETPVEEPVASAPKEPHAEELGDTKVYEAAWTEAMQQSQTRETDDLDIHVKTMDVGEYNTINLQAELAAGLKEVLGEEGIQDPITRSIVAPMMESDTETLDYPMMDEVSDEDLELDTEEIEDSEVFFGETGELVKLSQDEPSLTEEEIPVDEASSEEAIQEELFSEEETVSDVPDATAEIVMEQMRREEMGEISIPMWNAEPPKELANVLSQESDGQISLVMPEKENIEKQITGQMSIEDILAEWERMKKENEEKRKEEVRQHVLQQTGTMFTEFEAAVRDGLLEQLENGELEDDEPAVDSEESEESEEILDEIAEEAEEELLAEDTEYETEDIVWDVTDESAEVFTDISAEAVEEGAEEFREEFIEEASEEIEEEFIEEVPEVIEEEISEDKEPEKPAVERDKAKVRALTREERELYAPFVQSRSAREQLVQAVDNISLASYTGNIIITGEEGMDTLTLAKNMIREVQMEDSNFSGKVAKISGSALNKKDVSGVLKDLKNGALIIQKASEMNAKTAEALNKVLQQENIGIIVVMMDTKRLMNHFLTENEELHSCFTARMDMEALNNDTLVAFGRQYAREMEYSIDDMGVLALHTRIEAMQTIDHIVTVVEVKEIVDEAIRHANRKTLGHFFDVLLAKRYDGEDMIILGEKDFV